jgi:transcriptional repressor NrdR
MRCPFCIQGETKVIDSRLANEGDLVRRRRECLSCEERFTTHETAELILPRILKRNGAREEFDETKLRNSFLRAIKKQPVATDQVETAVSRIKHKLITSGDREIKSSQLGKWVMDQLEEMDEVAYVRFASVYLSFQDLNSFRELIETLENSPSRELRKRQIPLLPPAPAPKKPASASTRRRRSCSNNSNSSR